MVKNVNYVLKKICPEAALFPTLFCSSLPPYIPVTKIQLFLSLRHDFDSLCKSFFSKFILFKISFTDMTNEKCFFLKKFVENWFLQPGNNWV